MPEQVSHKEKDAQLPKESLSSTSNKELIKLKKTLLPISSHNHHYHLCVSVYPDAHSFTHMQSMLHSFPASYLTLTS